MADKFYLKLYISKVSERHTCCLILLFALDWYLGDHAVLGFTPRLPVSPVIYLSSQLRCFFRMELSIQFCKKERKLFKIWIPDHFYNPGKLISLI